MWRRPKVLRVHSTQFIFHFQEWIRVKWALCLDVIQLIRFFSHEMTILNSSNGWSFHSTMTFIHRKSLEFTLQQFFPSYAHIDTEFYHFAYETHCTSEFHLNVLAQDPISECFKCLHIFFWFCLTGHMAVQVMLDSEYPAGVLNSFIHIIWIIKCYLEFLERNFSLFILVEKRRKLVGSSEWFPRFGSIALYQLIFVLGTLTLFERKMNWIFFNSQLKMKLQLSEVFASE